MKKIIYCFVVLSFLLSACSNDLSRSKAEEMIKVDEEELGVFPLFESFTNDGIGQVILGSIHLNRDQIDQLGNEGYTLYEVDKIHGGGRIRAFTEKAKPFI